jgi:hypothetical protein
MKRKGQRTFKIIIPVHATVTASGYWDQGQTSGPPERCREPEGECSIERVQVDDKIFAQYIRLLHPGDGIEINIGDLNEEAIEKINDAFFAALDREEDDYEGDE